ncbi:MAG: hypothetical protein U0Q12_17125 [Vicinamibacterales bacterium]
MLPPSPSIAPAVASFLTGLIDYAGLFPPACASMVDAVREFGRHRASREGWILGRFVLPAGRLGEFAEAMAAHGTSESVGDPWPLSVIVGGDVDADVGMLNAAEARRGRRWHCASIELAPRPSEELASALDRTEAHAERYVELPVAGLSSDSDRARVFAAASAVLSARGALAKLRTGGVVADAIPDARDLALSIALLARAGVRFKATAGLHHPVRADHPLTYALGSPRARMHGFLCVFVGAVVAQRLVETGVPADRLAEAVLPVIEERDPSAFVLDGASVAWRDLRFGVDELAAATGRLAVSFGSCSFEEPVADLTALGWLFG